MSDSKENTMKESKDINDSSDNSDDDRPYDERYWYCSYCDRTFNSEGEVLVHEKTWCVFEHGGGRKILENPNQLKKKRRRRFFMNTTKQRLKNLKRGMIKIKRKLKVKS